MEPSLIQSLLDWVGQNHGWAGVIVFLVAMGESLAIVGMMVPGVAVMLGIGALISVGALPFWPMFWWAVAGAIAGDGFSFWLGYHFRDRLRAMWPFRNHPRLLERGEAFFERHGGKSVFFGRFFGPVRAIIPTTAGMMRMSPWHFNLINIASALLWAPVYLGMGMVIGASLSLAAEVATRLALLVAALGVTLWLGLWLLRRIYRFFAPRAAAMSERLLAWGRRHPLLGRLTAAIFDPHESEFKALAVLGALFLALAWAILWLFGQWSVGPPLARLDSSTYHLMQALRTPWGDRLMVAVSQLGDGIVHTVLVAVLGVWLAWRRQWLALAHWLAAVGFGAVAAWLLKQSLQLPRPVALYDGAMAYSFPSAHAILAVCSFGFLALMIAREVAPRWRRAVYAVAWGLILTIAFSRLYLGAHWLSDVLGGLVIGLIWITLLGTAFRRHATRPLPLRGLVAVPLLVVAGFGGWHVAATHEQNLARYAPQIEPPRPMSRAHWLESGWRELPALRIDTRGMEMQPLNLQWAGPLPLLEHRLEEHGWRVPPALTARSALAWLDPNATLATLPLLPQAHDGRHQQWQMIDPVAGRVIRLWRSGVVLEPEGGPLWIGYVAPLRLATPPLLRIPRVGEDFDTPVAELTTLLDGFAITLRRRAATTTDHRWSGTVALIRPPQENAP